MRDPLTLAFVDAYAGPHAAKRIARDADVSDRTAENWLRGLSWPGLPMAVRMARRNAKLRENLARLMAEDAGQ